MYMAHLDIAADTVDTLSHLLPYAFSDASPTDNFQHLQFFDSELFLATGTHFPPLCVVCKN